MVKFSLQTKKAGCLVLDVRMPEMSGLELHAEMRRRGLRLPVIFVTGHGDVDMAVQSIKNGATVLETLCSSP